MKNLAIVVGTIIAYTVAIVGFLLLLEEEYSKTKFY